MDEQGELLYLNPLVQEEAEIFASLYDYICRIS